MDRQILFRGKRIDNGKWVSGCFVQMVNNGPVGIMRKGNFPTTLPSDFLFRESLSEVDPKTVSQYTGLTDNNDKKIFENDIVKLILSDGEIRYFKVSIKSVIRKVLCHPDFDDDVSKVEIVGVVFEWNGYELFPCVDTYSVPDYKVMEVVGNIFDNPELIEKPERSSK